MNFRIRMKGYEVFKEYFVSDPFSTVFKRKEYDNHNVYPSLYNIPGKTLLGPVYMEVDEESRLRRVTRLSV